MGIQHSIRAPDRVWDTGAQALVHCYLGSLLCGCAPLLLLTTCGNTFARLRLLGLFNNLSTSPSSAHKEEAWESGCGAILLLLQWILKRRSADTRDMSKHSCRNCVDRTQVQGAQEHQRRGAHYGSSGACPVDCPPTLLLLLLARLPREPGRDI